MKNTARQVMIICFLLGATLMYAFMKFYHTDEENRQAAYNWYYDDAIVKNAQTNPNSPINQKNLNFLEDRTIMERENVSPDWRARITAELWSNNRK